MKFNNIICKIFGHNYKCFMGCQSVCNICGDVWAYNVEDCGICGGKLKLINKKGYGQLLLCENGCFSKKYWKKHKMSNKKYLQKKNDGIESEGLLRNLFNKNRISGMFYAIITIIIKLIFMIILLPIYLIFGLIDILKNN